ncbi:hypothetical protein F5884DRAFT_859267 [Xylogone sp. PMI_703]|nr:hypothetical protein F5884DRAFT_859267 [Xylogone sp. PMI_703]
MPSSNIQPKCAIVQAPIAYTHSPDRATIFLAGSISTWRSSLFKHFSNHPITFLDPYRPDWDSTWKEDIECEKFRTQTQWELDMQDKATLVAFWFQPETLAPVSLLELGLVLGKRGSNASREVVVMCPEKYWKRGNVQVVCHRYGVEVVDSLENLCEALERRLRELGVSNLP